MTFNMRIGLCSDRLTIQHDGGEAEDIFPMGSAVSIVCLKGEIYLFTGEGDHHFHKTDKNMMPSQVTFKKSTCTSLMDLEYPQFIVDNVTLIAEGTGLWKVVLPPVHEMPWNSKPFSLNEEELIALFVKDMTARISSAVHNCVSIRKVIDMRPSWSKGLVTGKAWMMLINGELA